MEKMHGNSSNSSEAVKGPAIPLSQNLPTCQHLLSIPSPFLGLPSDILRRVLSQYCNGKTLSTLQLALGGSSYHRDVSLKLMATSILDQRLENVLLKTEAANRDSPLSVSKYKSQVQQCIHDVATCTSPASPSQSNVAATTAACVATSTPTETEEDTTKLNAEDSVDLDPSSIPWASHALLDFFEHNATRRSVWCGTMDFPSLTSSNSMSGERTQISVIVQASHCSWTRKALCGWCETANAFSYSLNNSSCEKPPTDEQSPNIIRLSQPQPYNFVPIPPYGRILGKSPESQEALKRIGEYLEAHDLVITLPDLVPTTIQSVTTCSGRRRTINRQHSQQRRLIVRIISPNQARDRVRRRLGASYRPPDWDDVVGDCRELDVAKVMNHNAAGLVCCWEYEGGDDEATETSISSRVQDAIVRILNEYHHRSEKLQLE